MYDKIILALSLEHGFAEQAIETAQRLGGKSAEIIALHVYEPLSGSVSTYLDDDLVQQAYTDATRMLAASVATRSSCSAAHTRASAASVASRRACSAAATRALAASVASRASASARTRRASAAANRAVSIELSACAVAPASERSRPGRRRSRRAASSGRCPTSRAGRPR